MQIKGEVGGSHSMRRVLIFLLLASLFAGWLVLLHQHLSIRPKYEFATGLKRESGGQFATIVDIDHISDDGELLVTDTADVGPFMRHHTWKHWDSRSGRCEESKSTNEGWQAIHDVAGKSYYKHDPGYWRQFLERWQEKRSNENIGKNPKEKEDEEAPFPVGKMSADGNCFAYPRDPGPLLQIPKGEGFDVFVEEVATGRIVATIRDEQDPIFVAPGGTYAAATDPNFYFQEKGGIRHLILWDLAKGEVIAKPRLPDCVVGLVEFSPDGQFVFAWCWALPEPMVQGLIWFDMSGRQRGIAPADERYWAISNEGRTLVVFRVDSKGESPRYVIDYWDLQTCESLGSWTIPTSEKLGHIPSASSSQDGRYFGIVPPLLPYSEADEGEHRFLIVDTQKREIVGCDSACSGTFSPNNRYLATIDIDGYVKVWDFPLRRPWRAAIPMAVIAMLASWALISILFFLFRRVRRPA
jgi:hypothetical protein